MLTRRWKEELIGVRILIEGERVQGVGYRIFLLRKAFECGIRNLYARNVDTDKVEALVSDEEYKVNGFYEILEKEKPKEAIVKYVKREPYNNKIPIPSTTDFLHLLTFEEMSEGRGELVKLRDELREGFSEGRGEIVKLREEITEELGEGRGEVVKLREELTGEVVKLREEIREELGEGRGEVVKLREEITEKLPDKVVDAFIDRIKRALK